MSFGEEREGIGERVVKSEFEVNEERLRDIMRRNVGMFAKVMVVNDESDVTITKYRLWQGCADGKGLLAKKGQHSKDIY